jgi:hypothetical protein
MALRGVAAAALVAAALSLSACASTTGGGGGGGSGEVIVLPGSQTFRYGDRHTFAIRWEGTGSGTSRVSISAGSSFAFDDGNRCNGRSVSGGWTCTTVVRQIRPEASSATLRVSISGVAILEGEADLITI